MPQTTLRLLLSHYYRRSTSCLFCGRSHLPKGHSKGPDAVGGAKAIRSVLFFISAASIHPPHRCPPWSFCHPRRPLVIPTCRKDSTANIRPALLPHLWRSERPFSQRYPLQFCDRSVYILAPRYFLWFISIKNTAITRPTPSGRPCDKHSTQTAYRIARPTYHRRPRSQSRQVW